MWRGSTKWQNCESKMFWIHLLETFSSPPPPTPPLKVRKHFAPHLQYGQSRMPYVKSTPKLGLPPTVCFTPSLSSVFNM